MGRPRLPEWKKLPTTRRNDKWRLLSFARKNGTSHFISKAVPKAVEQEGERPRAPKARDDVFMRTPPILGTLNPKSMPLQSKKIAFWLLFEQSDVFARKILPPPPQLATTARKSARCGTGAGSPRPHQPRPQTTERAAEPCLPAPRDRRQGEGQRLTPDAPHNGGRPPPPGRGPATKPKWTVLGPHARTPAPTARG